MTIPFHHRLEASANVGCIYLSGVEACPQGHDTRTMISGNQASAFLAQVSDLNCKKQSKYINMPSLMEQDLGDLLGL